eukprot:15450966-Alexandrium_andersonii.AAC.1
MATTMTTTTEHTTPTTASKSDHECVGGFAHAPSCPLSPRCPERLIADVVVGDQRRRTTVGVQIENTRHQRM